MITGVILGTAALGLIVSLFGDRYECSPEEVQEACEELSNISNNTLQAISDEIGKEVGIVNNAASAASGLLDISNMNAYAPAVQDSITNLISVLDKQAEMIEEYNNGNLVEKMLGTGTMAILNLTEGIARFGEDIVDAGANIIAGVGTFCGFDMEEVELWAAKDHIGDAFDDAFENGAFNWVEKYSIYSHESTAAEIFKGIGTAIPYIALAATGVGLAAEATVAGAAGFGRGSTNYQQQHLEYDANGVASFDDTYSTGSMMWEGTKQGVVDAALTVGMDVGFKAIGNGISKLRAGKGIGKVAETATQNADEVTKALTTTSDDAARAVVNGTDDAGKALLKNADGTVKNVINGVDDAGKATLKNVDGTAKNVINGVDDAGKATLKNVDGTAKNVINGVDDAGKATLKNVDGTAKNVINGVDDAGRAVANSADDVGRAVANSADDVGRTVVNSADDAGRALINSADDAGRAVANSADDAGRALINSADDAGRTVANSADDVGRTVVNGADDAMEATVKGSDSATLSQAKQDLLKRYQSGEITRDEMLDGVRRAANPEEALKADKAQLLNDFRSGKITRDEMIQGIQKSAGNAPTKAVVNSADDAGRALINSADDAGRTVVNGASETGENAFSRYAKQMSEGEKLKYDRFIRGTDDAGRTVVNGASETGENAFSRYAKQMSEGEKLKYDRFIRGTDGAGKGIGDLAEKAATNADDVTKALTTTSDDAARAVINGTDDTGKALINSTDNVANATTNAVRKTDYELTEELNNIRKAVREGKMTPAEGDAAAKIVKNQLKEVHPDVLAGQAARKATTGTAEQTARKAATGTAEQTARKAASGTAEQTVRKAASGTAEQATSKATQSGSKWHSPLEATTPRAKVARAYDTAVENMKNAASDVKSKIKGAFDGMKPSGNTAPTGPRIGDDSIPARVTQAYDNAVEGIKNVGAKAGTTAKKVVTDTATFVKENPKRAVIGGGLLSAEKAIGNMKTSYIPTNYASTEVQELSKIGGGENRIVIDDVDDMITQESVNTPTDTNQIYNGGDASTAGGTYTAPTTPSSNTSPGTNGTGTSTTPIEKPSDSNTTTPGTNDDNNNNNDNQDNNKSDDLNKTPDNNTPATPEPTPGDNVNTEVSNPPSNNNQGSSGTNHGGTTNNNTGNSSTGNNNWNSNTTTESGIEENPELEPELPIEDSDLIDEPNEEESVYTIPSNLSGVKQTKKTSSGSSVLPILGGLGAAAAVGVGAKMYLDNKKNNENGDDDEEYSDGDDENFNTSENDDLLADEWNGEDTEFNYEDSSGDNSVETDDDDLGEM